MTRFHFERPDGIAGNPQNILIHLNEFVPPQGIGSGGGSQQTVLMNYENSFQKLWTQRIARTIQVGQVPSPQTDFTLLINNTFPDLIGVAEKELRFTGVDSVPLPYYIQEFDNVTGRLVARFLKPTVADGDLIYIYFDNPAAIDEQDARAVWQGMDFVYPLDEPDLTCVNLVGVPSTKTTTTQVDGKIFKATNFADGSQFIQFTTPDWITQRNNMSMSIAFWYKTGDQGRGILVGNFTVASIGPDINIELTTDDRLRAFITSMPDEFNTDTQTPSSSKFQNNQWHLVVFTYNKDTRNPRIYFDGGLEVTGVPRPDNSDVFLDTTIPYFAARDNRTGTTQYVGDMELLRKFQDIELDADAIATMYNNENNDNAFYSGNASEPTPVPPTIDMEYESGILMEYNK